MNSHIVHLECGLDDEALRSEHPAFPFEIGPLRFATGEADRADWLVETLDVKRSVVTVVPRERRILVATEPVVDLPADYVNQFGIILAPQPIAGFTGAFFQGHGALPLRFGRDVSRPGFPSVYSFEALSTMRPPAKRNAVAAVVSTKTILPGHRRRLRFLRALKSVLGDRLDLYGDGLEKIPVKAEAILPYKYHLVLENTVMPSYWTEKLADAFVGFALPVVSGPPDLTRWFPAESFVPIDLGDIGAAVATVTRVMDDDLYEQQVAAIAQARGRVLRDERLCPVVARVIAAHPDRSPRLSEPVMIHPAPKLPVARRLTREARRFYWRMAERVRSGISGRL